jgi:hypothetical protein
MNIKEDITHAVAISNTGDVTHYVFDNSLISISELIDIENRAISHAARKKYRLFKVYINDYGDERICVSWN